MPRTSKAERKLAAATDAYLKNVSATSPSPKTAATYTSTLVDFMNFFIAGDENYKDPTYTTIAAWRDSLVERGLTPNTVRQYLVRLHMFFDFACDPACGGWYETNPVSRRFFPQTARESARPYDPILTDRQVMLLWRYDKAPGCRRDTWPRNYAIVILLLTTELRNAELLSLTPADLLWDEGELIVERGKGNKFRRVEFPEIAQSAVRLYLASGLRPKDLPDTAPLFGTTSPKEFGARIRDSAWTRGSSQWLSGIVLRHVKAVTGVDNVRSHDLRHVGARLDLNSGMSQAELQAKLGHASPGTTQVYSGRLLSRTGRKSAVLVREEQEKQSDLIANLLTSNS